MHQQDRFLFLPVGGTLLTCIIMAFVIGAPLAALNHGMEQWLLSMSGSNKVILAAVIGAMVDLTLARLIKPQ